MICYEEVTILKCVVTGSVGFIGSHLVNYLKAKGHWVRGVDIRSKSECYLSTTEDEFLQLDLRFFKNAVSAVTDIDWVFNLAADMGGIGYITEYNASIMRNNSLINLNMLEASRLADIDRYFFSSSACTYNRDLQMESNSPPLKESDVLPAHPDSAYGWEKLYAELLCKSYEHDHGLPVRIARFHNIYGTHCTYTGGQEKFPAAACRKVAEAHDDGRIVLWGDGKQRRSYLWIDDCCEAFYRLVRSSFSDPVNIGTDRSIGVDELAYMVMRIAGKKLTIDHDLNKPQGVRGRNADLSLIREVLGWEPKIELEEGMSRLYKWVESQLVRDSLVQAERILERAQQVQSLD